MGNLRVRLVVLLGVFLAAAGTTITAAAADPLEPSHPSVVVSPVGASLRSCPRVPNEGETTDCAEAERLPEGAHVQMICWSDGAAPPDGTSRRWFWVTDLDGPHPGLADFIWSDLVGQQWTAAPPCTDQLMGIPHPMAVMEQGPPAPQGYRYEVTLLDYWPNTTVQVDCYDSTAPGRPFYSFPLATDARGFAHTSNECYSGDGPEHWYVTGDSGIPSNRVPW